MIFKNWVGMFTEPVTVIPRSHSWKLIIISNILGKARSASSNDHVTLTYMEFLDNSMKFVYISLPTSITKINNAFLLKVLHIFKSIMEIFSFLVFLIKACLNIIFNFDVIWRLIIILPMLKRKTYLKWSLLQKNMFTKQQSKFSKF